MLVSNGGTAPENCDCSIAAAAAGPFEVSNGGTAPENCDSLPYSVARMCPLVSNGGTAPENCDLRRDSSTSLRMRGAPR